MKTLAALGALLVTLMLSVGAAQAAAPIQVNSTADAAGGCTTADDTCTLRGAIQAANAAGGDVTIDVPAGTYKLTIAPDSGSGDDVTTGDLNIDDSSGTVTIHGAGAASTIIDANQLDRAFYAQTPAEIDGVTVENGNTTGTQTGAQCPAANSGITPAPGGGILADQAIALTNDVVTGNLAAGSGGGVEAETGSGQQVTVTSTVFSDNQACAVGSRITDLAIIGNAIPFGDPTTLGNGGGLGVLQGTALTVDGSRFDGNRAQGSGGGIDSTFGFSFVPELRLARAAAASKAAATISHTTFSANTASYGGAISHYSNNSEPWLIDSDTMSGNSGAAGGYGDGGGYYASGSTDTIVNSTITGNTASDGGGVYVDNAMASSNVTLSFDTVTSNTATGVGGTGNLTAARPTASITLDDTIVSGGTGGPASDGGTAGADDCSDASSGSGFTSNGHNLFDENGQCNVQASDIVNAQPGLQALADNGGPTQTQALNASSPAVDTADPSLCPQETSNVDQRGFTRPSGSACDIGAFELQQAPDLGLTASVSKPTITVGDADTITDTVTNHGTASATSVSFTDPAPGGYTITSATPGQGTCSHTSTTVTCSLGTLAAGASATVTIGLTGTSAGVVTLTSHVAMDQTDPTPGDDTASAQFTVNGAPAPTPTPTPTPPPTPTPTPPVTKPSAPIADLAVSEKVAPSAVIVGHMADYTVTVTDRGPNTALGTVVLISIPSGASVVSIPSGCTASVGLRCAVGTLARKHHRTFDVQVRGNTVGPGTSVAKVTGSLPDPNLNNNRDSATLNVVPVPMCASTVFRDRLDIDDWVLAVRVYINGRLRRVAHGKNLRKFKLRPAWGSPRFSARLEFVQDDRRIGVATTTFRGCSSGPIHWQLVSPPGSLNEP